MIAVVTDTCACIPPSVVENLQIEIVPYYLHRGAETLRDGVDITGEEFYRWLPTARQLPTTANPGPGDYLAAFDRVAGCGSQIVVVLTMTPKGSGAYQSACVAREMAAPRPDAAGAGGGDRYAAGGDGARMGGHRGGAGGSGRCRDQ